MSRLSLSVTTIFPLGTNTIGRQLLNCQAGQRGGKESDDSASGANWCISGLAAQFAKLCLARPERRVNLTEFC